MIVRKPLVAWFGAKRIIFNKHLVISDRKPQLLPGRNELVKRLLADQCEVCGSNEGVNIISSKMFVVPAWSLKILAAIVWYGGGIALLLKGSCLFFEAHALQPEQGWPWLAVVIGMFLGYLKARYLFSKSCRRNLDRITALERPRIWQFFRPGFFAALAVMIFAGATLSRLAHNHYAFLVGVAILDLAISVALLGSSYVFWNKG